MARADASATMRAPAAFAGEFGIDGHRPGDVELDVFMGLYVGQFAAADGTAVEWDEFGSADLVFGRRQKA